MPGFVKTPADEARWSKAKKAASKQTREGSDSYYALSNYIYHKMGKSQEDVEKAEFYKNELKKQLLGSVELSEESKKPSVRKLKTFLQNHKGKSNLK